MLEDCCGTKYDVIIPRLKPIAGHFRTNYELNSGKGTTISYFAFMAGYHNVPLLGSD